MKPALAALALAGCASPAAPQASIAPLDPIAFFTGATHGEGQLKAIMSKSRAVHVTSMGTVRDGTLTLTQRIVEGDKPARVRSWTMRPTGPGRWTGALTDAVGPVSVVAADGGIDIAYTMKKGLKVRQRLVLVAPGRIANHMRIAKAGITVATLTETISKP